MITDEMLAEAAAELNQALIDSLPDPHECKHHFSKKFERKMEKLIHRVNHPIRYMVLNRVASILLVILIGFTMVMSFSSTARATVIGWIKATFESFYSYYFVTDTKTESNYKYQIDPLPEGYVEMSYTENDGYHIFIYSNGESVLVFSYADGDDPSLFYVKKEEYYVKEIRVDGNPGDLYISKDGKNANGIVWCDVERGCIFFITGQFDSQEIKKLAECVIQCPNLP